jgi:hypothetical protein
LERLDLKFPEVDDDYRNRMQEARSILARDAQA